MAVLQHINTGLFCAQKHNLKVSPPPPPHHHTFSHLLLIHTQARARTHARTTNTPTHRHTDARTHAHTHTHTHMTHACMHACTHDTESTLLHMRRLYVRTHACTQPCMSRQINTHSTPKNCILEQTSITMQLVMT